MALTSELEAAERRLARMVNRRADLEEEQARADAVARERELVAQVRDAAERRRQYQARYADAFAAFGSQPPAPIEDERPGQYRQRLYEHLRRKLPDGHELATVRADEIPAGRPAAEFERMLLEAAKAEGEQPSPNNLPRDGSMISRARVDPDSGLKKTEYFGRESFIKSMGREAKRVACFATSRGNVYFPGGAG
jgi:hypothetical protein